MEHNHQMEELQQGLMQIQQQLQMLQHQISELEQIKESLEEMKKAKQGDEILVPMGAGVFLKSTLKDVGKVLMNVGTGTVVEKTLIDALELVESQLTQLHQIESDMAQELSNVSQQMDFMKLSTENHDE